MPSVSLSPIKEFHIDLANVLHRATILELKLKEAEEWAQRMDKLDSLTNMNVDHCSEWDEDIELTVSDTSAITKEKEDKLHDIQQFRAELEETLDRLQDHYETPLQDFLSEEDGESVQLYGQKLISWFESVRGHLIEILGRTSILLKEKEERKKRMKEESKFVQESLDEIATLQTYVMKTESKLNEVAQRQKSTTPRRNNETEPISKPPDEMDVDGDSPPSLQMDTVAAEVSYPVLNREGTTGNNFTALLEDTKTNLREFRASRQTYASKADSLHDQTTKVFHNAPPSYPITPVRNVEIDAIELDPTIRRIVVEEFELLYGHFLSSLAEEKNKREEEAMSNLTNTMAESNKLVCKLLFCLGYDGIEEGSLNGRPDYPLGSDAIAS